MWKTIQGKHERLLAVSSSVIKIGRFRTKDKAKTLHLLTYPVRKRHFLTSGTNVRNIFVYANAQWDDFIIHNGS